jgi:predicted acylesterase/phospholipase RssA/CRP-like cAMP-binding protein
VSEQPDEGTIGTAGTRVELQQLLAHDPLFSSLEPNVLRDLIEACDHVEVPGGARLLRAGETLDSMLIVVHGGLRVMRRRDDGAEQPVRDFYRGSTIGVMGLLCERPFAVDLFAIRDSTLLRLPRARFLALTSVHPSLLLALARLMGDRAFEVLEELVTTRRDSPATRAGNLAILPLSLDPTVLQCAGALIPPAMAARPLTHVSAALVDAALGPGTADGDGNGRVTGWLSNLERRADVVLYECDPTLPGWTARCIRQSDRLVIVAAADREPRLDILERATADARRDGLSRPIDLVLVHSSLTSMPAGTQRWRKRTDIRGIHHVRSGSHTDLARTVRRIMGRPVGLVLSGGGARGIAHVGVIAAIIEAGIPIDYVCGTSMGAIFGAGLALGFDIDRMRAEVHDLFAKPFALYDLTLPISSLLAGNKLDRVLRGQMGEVDIEDLWLPFFCVSTDLSHAKLVVHDRGCLWRCVRASCSIPGIFPPVPMGGCTLVDGGLVDNLPLDLMLERCSGPIIAVDVFPYGDPGFEQPTNAISRWLRAARTRIRGEQASPPLFDILMRSTLVGSKYRQQVAMNRAEQIVYLEPPVAGFGTLQWRAHRALFDIGHDYARDQLASQRAIFPAS